MSQRLKLSRLDYALLPALVLLGVTYLASNLGVTVPFIGFIGFFLLFVGLPYVAWRLTALVRQHLLWSLRNRLIVAYLFIAVVPVLLLGGMALLTADLLYTQIGAFLFHQEVQGCVREVSNFARVLAAITSSRESSRDSGETRFPTKKGLPEHLLKELRARFAGSEVRFLDPNEAAAVRAGVPDEALGVLVQSGDQIWIRAVEEGATPRGNIFVEVRVPITADLLGSFDPAIGTVQMIVTRPASDADAPDSVLLFGERRLVSIRQLPRQQRILPARKNMLDFRVSGVAQFEAVVEDGSRSPQLRNPVFAPFATRTSLINAKLFGIAGDLTGVYVTALLLIGGILLVIEFGALVTGIVVTRTITAAVAELYGATQHVQKGDFSHRVRLKEKDQLGSLGESFNEMTSSIVGLIEEQKQRQKLENELAIAQEVQSQLFPHSLPQIPLVELAAVCRAARVVSGDFYDFIKLGPHLLGIAVADISGKGISAAILMASLQAALRSQALGDIEVATNPAELVTRLNRHLYLNTSEDRYATFFYAVYDAAARTLRYTNAGHLPPLYLEGNLVIRLDQGGTVVGLIESCNYDQGVIEVGKGGLLVAYSDGLIEPENVFGQEFGSKRLEEEVLRHRTMSPRALAESLVASVEGWASSAEASDDMTVIVAKMN